MNNIKIQLPMDEKTAVSLKAGDTVLLTGEIYTGRDAAHRRLYEECIQQGKPLPVDLKDQLIYYVGPTPAKPGYAVGSAGPTSSYRMDAYTPPLLDLGMRGMIGKGKRSPEVIEAMKRNKAVYLAAVGGVAALISKSIKKAENVCYEDLGTEAIQKYYVEDFPAIVVIDTEGNNAYELGVAQYRQ